MNRSTLTKFALAALTFGAIGAGTAANARPADGYVVIDNGRPAYVQNDNWRHREARRDRDWDAHCRAPAWNPNTRYAPGQVVWRDGELYRARRISGDVYNVNSPPEWTPRYWTQVACR
jgi:hypothetical protein